MTTLRSWVLAIGTGIVGVALYMSNRTCINIQITKKEDLQQRVLAIVDSNPTEKDFERLASESYPNGTYLIIFDLEGHMRVNTNAPWLCSDDSKTLGPSLLDTPGEQRPPIQTMVNRAKTGGGFEQFTWAYADRLELHTAFVMMLRGGPQHFVVGVVTREPKN